MVHVKCYSDLEAYEALYKFQGARIKFYCDHVFYTGIIDEILPQSNHVKLRHTKIADSDTYFGTLCFRFSNIKSFSVIESAESVNRIPRNDYLLSILKQTRVGPDDSYIKVLYGDRLSEDSDEEDVAEEEFTLNVPFHLKNRLPSDCTTIDECGNDFKLAVRHISRQSVIGVSLEGPLLSRFGKLTWVCISTRNCVFLFDIQAMKKEAFDKGLRDILETKSIKKVLHNCRWASDLLSSQFSTQLTNVFDTQVAKFVIDLQRYKDKYEFKNVSSLELCIRDSLEVPPEFLFKQENLESDDKNAYFSKRPISNAFKHDLVNKVLYLILVQEKFEKELLDPLHKLTDDYLRVLGNAGDDEFYSIGKDLSPPDAIPPGVLMHGIQTIKFKNPETKAPVPLARNLKDLQSGQILEPSSKIGSASKNARKNEHSRSSNTRSKFSDLKIRNVTEESECVSMRPSHRLMDEIFHKLANKACGSVNPSVVGVKPSDTYISNFSVRKSCFGSSESTSSGYNSAVEGSASLPETAISSERTASSTKRGVPETSDIWARIARIRASSSGTVSQYSQNTKIVYVPG